MSFAEKLNFLMDITKTSNSTLAHSVALDASYISRLRTGKRLMPKDSHLIQDMAACLVRRFTEDYQKKTLSDTLKLMNLPSDNSLLANEVAHWLIHDGENNAGRVERFLGGFSTLESRSVSAQTHEEYQPAFPKDAVSIYYGVEGKRRAAEYFLAEVAMREKPQTLLLFSDEETSWMTADPEYARKWAGLMVHMLSRGNKIKIIHTLSRDLDEMLSALNQWMPLYMSGAIEPYFYPKKRDGIFKRTLFIAPETAAVVSSSIGDQVELAANILHRDPAAIASFAEEFLHYLHLCRSLMRIFTARERDACNDTVTEFERGQADTLIKTESLSLPTMPERLLASIVERSGIDAANHLSVHAARRQRFLESLQSNQFTELIHLPDMEMLESGGIKVSMSDMLGGGAVFYTPEEYVAHLEQVISLRSSYENYRVVLIDRAEDRFTVYAREELGVIVAKTSQPPVVLAISESNMVAAFWDFLKSMAGEKALTATDKGATIRQLEDYVQKLRAEI